MSTYTLEGLRKKLLTVQGKAANMLANESRAFMEVALLDLLNNVFEVVKEIEDTISGKLPPMTPEDLKTAGEIVGQIDFQFFILVESNEANAKLGKWSLN